MKYIIFLVLVLIGSAVHAQTPQVIPATTTVEAFGNLPPGTYRFFTTGTVKDTINLSNVACPTCPAVPVCPVCPPAPKIRNATGFTINKNGTVTVTYDTGPVSTFTLKNPILVQ